MPPKRGSAWLRERFCEPVPHDLVQVVQAFQPLVTQSFGQLCKLHVLASRLCGQATQPKLGCTLVRVRDCEPLPHDMVHVVQALNWPTTQFTGQACWLQRRVSYA